MKIYFAGKITQNCYRTKIFNNERIMSVGAKEYKVDGINITYIGPNAFGCDHGCFHGKGTHGLMGNDSGSIGSLEISPDQNVFYIGANTRCKNQIAGCDLFYARIDSLDCFGTIMEIGIAKALKKPIHVSINETQKDLWFVLQDCNVVVEEYASLDPLFFFKDLLNK